jgi:hypothetical protein
VPKLGALSPEFCVRGWGADCGCAAAVKYVVNSALGGECLLLALQNLLFGLEPVVEFRA